ncbi:MAG: SAM-dependent methyltransferase [Paramuribaculum sp.]|nr:SAM-dependent methyltransferase [Paramuribaculum sp.]
MPIFAIVNITTEKISGSRATLYLLPVPLSDVAPASVMPEHNIDIARSVKHFIVENVRSARRFLKRCDPSIDISELSFVVLDEHTDPADVAEMLAPLADGMDMAVISEAGCPGVADPGALAVDAALRRGLGVQPLIGPSSILLSLMASGFNGQKFAFEGYLPHDTATRQRRLKEMTGRINREDQTQIFIETPYRNNRLIAELSKTLPGSIRLCVCSDLTGVNQKIVCQTISEWSRSSYNFDKIPAIFLLYK